MATSAHVYKICKVTIWITSFNILNFKYQIFVFFQLVNPHPVFLPLNIYASLSNKFNIEHPLIVGMGFYVFTDTDSHH